MDYKKMSYISGVIVFFAIIIFFCGILWLSGQQIIFSNKYIVYFKFEDVVGLRDRSPVFMRGYRIGWTKDVFFEDDGVRVRVDIENKFKIPTDSKIEINTLNLMGEKAITIAPGDSKQFIEPRTIVKGDNNDLMAIVKNLLLDVKKRVEKGELDKHIKNLGSSISSFKKLVNNLNAKLDKLDMALINRQIKHVGSAGRELKDFIATDTRALTADARETIKTFNGSLKKLDDTLDELKGVSKELKAIATKINEGKGTAGKLLNDRELLNRINTTIAKLNEFLADIKKNPKKYVRFSIF